MQSFSPSPDLQNRVITHTESRLRQRRQAAVGVIVGSSALLMVFGVILVNQNSTRSNNLNAAADSSPPLIPTVTPTQPPTVPQSVVATTAPTTVPVTTLVPVVAPTSVPSTVAPSSAPAATELPFDGRSLSITYEDSLPRAAAEQIVELGVDIPMGGDGTQAYPDYNFASTGSGVVTVLSPDDHRVMTAAPNGERVNYTLRTDDPAGRIWDAAVGPDGRLYVSRSADGAATFTLVVYELDSATGSATEVLRHSTAWGCYESYCGEVLFTPGGVEVVFDPLETIAYESPEAGAQLLPLFDTEPYEWTPDDRCTARDDFEFFYGNVASLASLNGTRYRVSVSCATGAPHSTPTALVPGRDGSLLAFSSLSGPTAEDAPRGVVGHFRADGTQVTFEVGPNVREVAFADGQYVGIEFYEEGGYGHWRLVRLNVPE